MQVEIVRARTEDGIRLAGAFQIGESMGKDAAGLDAIVFLHGVGSNFYGSSMIETLAQQARSSGVHALRVNTRGHDGVSTVSTDQGGRLLGAAYEVVADCCHDVDAWCDWLITRDCSRIGLVGHSLGAVKALYSQAFKPHPAVKQIVAISPPRLAHSRFSRSQNVRAFRESLETARTWISDEQPEMLFRASFPFPLVLSAATFMDKYGEEERYNFLRFTERIGTRVDFVFGEDELSDPSAAFDGIVEEIKKSDWGNGLPDVHVIPHANHFYSGQLESLSSLFEQLVRSASEDEN